MTDDMIVVCYDISDDDLRDRLRKTLLRYGDPVQYSVFECVLSDAKFEELRKAVARVLEGSDESDVRYYALCEASRRKTRTLGRGTTNKDRRAYVL